jgi:hypothetical protein
MKRAAVVLALLLFPATAHAGTYHVYACGAYANNSWTANAAGGVTVDTSCAGGTIGASVAPGATTPNGGQGGLVFRSPAGTSVAGFTLSRQLDYVPNPPKDTHRHYAIYALGGTVFAGAGYYTDATRNALNAQHQWYGYPGNAAHTGRQTVVRATFPALAAPPASNALGLLVGCLKASDNCSGSTINHRIYSADVLVSDPTAPALTVEASGLLAGGQRGGSDPVTVTASDVSGIRRIELIDSVSGVVGAADSACNYSKPAPCPNVSRKAVRPSSMPAGARQITVRVYDTGGNITDRGPFPVDAITPSDRGAFNGANATDTGSLQVAFTHSKATRRTVGYGQQISIGGRLRNSSGAPVSNAQIEVLTRDVRRGAVAIARHSLTTRADGSFNYRAPASASRLIQFAWRAHVNDTRYTTSAYLTLNVRASATLHTSTRRPRVGAKLAISGRMQGVDREGVTIIVQGRARGSRHWATFADTTASRTGIFKVHYRFRASGSHGKRFQFRARIRPGATSPYKTGYSKVVTVRVR